MQIFTEDPNIKFQTNQSRRTHAETCGQTDLTKLIGALGIHWNAPKKSHILPKHFIFMSYDYHKMQELCPSADGICNGAECFL
jgi:hypothetical protein